jgi:phenylpropionate dioxygenase-like ring-hydroxylating dioxygenase large terminal subunit
MEYHPAPSETSDPFNSHDTHVQSWYVLARSAELKPGKAQLRDFLGRKIALFRGRSGKAFAIEARCAHLGAMLAMGDVIGDEIRCPFHHWKFNGDGRCVHIPYREEIPATAKNFAYPLEEKHGLVWIFFGPKALFPVPTFDGIEGQRPYLRPKMVVRTHPHLILPNSVDMNHWECIHGILVEDQVPATEIDAYRLRHVVRGRLVDQPLTWAQKFYKFFGKTVFEWEWISWGGNVCTINVSRPFVMKFMLTYVPIPGTRTSQAQTVLYGPRRPRWMDRTGLSMVLMIPSMIFSLLLFYDDMKVMNTIEFWPHLTKEDSMIAQWIRHIRSLPVFKPGARVSRSAATADPVSVGESLGTEV